MSLAAYGIAPPKAGKVKQDRSFGGFMSNLFGGASDALVGIIPGFYQLGKSAWHDASTGARGGSQLYRMGQDVAKSFEDYYKPLFKGQFGKFGANVYDNPIQLGLDVATLFTGGGAAAGKIGSKLAKSSKPGSTGFNVGAKLAGLEHIGEGMTAANAAKTLSTARQAQAVAHNLSGVLVPKQRHFMLENGNIAASLDVKRNPVVRARRALVAQALDRDIKGVGDYFTSERRGVRMHKAQLNRADRRVRQQVLGDAATATRGLSKAARHAVFYRIAGFNTPERAAALVEQRTNKLTEVKGRTRVEKHDGKYRSTLERALGRYSSDEFQRELLTPSDETLKAERLLLEAEDALQADRQLREAPGDRRTRAEMPLKTIMGEDYVIDPGERLGIISYSEDFRPKSVRKKAGSGSLTAAKRVEDMQSKGVAFANAAYKADPTRILKSYMDEMNYKRVGENLEYALQLSEKYNPDDPVQAQLRDEGKLHVFTVGDKSVRQLDEVAGFVSSHLRELAAKAGSKEVDQYLGGYQAWRDELGGSDAFVMPTSAWNELKSQAAGAEGLMKRLIAKPTRFWRDITLSLKGSFYMNNFLGNLVLGLISYGAFTYTKSLLNAGLRGTESGKRVRHMAPDERRAGQSSAAKDIDGFGEDRGSLKNPVNATGALGEKVSTFMSRFTEENFRMAAIDIELKRDAARLAAVRGIDKNKAIDEILNDGEAVDLLIQRAAGNMLDYSRLTPFERDTLRTFMPFWSFIRESTGRSVRLTLDEPWKIQAAAAMSESALATNEETFGELPPYLRALAQLGPLKDGKAPVMSLYAANPLGAPADMAKQISSVISGDDAGENQSPMAQFNPFIRSGIEAAIGRDLFFDKPLRGGYAQRYGSQLAGNFWPVRTHQTLRYGQSPTGALQRTPAQVALQWGGVNTGTLNLGNVRRQLAISRYYAQKEKDAQRRYDSRRDQSDRGLLLGLGS